MKIKIEAVIDVVDNWCDLNDQEELEWFLSVMNDKKDTFVYLHSNDVGDTIGQTSEFKFELIK
jgi:hypothetical protein